DQARIDAAGQIGADRYVTAQMHPNRIIEQLDQAALEIARIVLEIDLVTDVPIAPDLDPAVLDNQRMTGRQLLDAAEQGRLADGILEGQILGERGRIGLDIRQE